MASGAIAFDVLKAESPQTLAAVVALLKRHPQFGTRWEEKLTGLSEEDQGRHLFMLAARWPDDIRGNKKYDHPFWHFINYPFKPTGQPESVKPAEPKEENIVQAFCRDLLVDALLRIYEMYGLLARLHVHDEGMWNVLKQQAARLYALLSGEMKVPPAWAVGMPIEAAGWIGRRYRKG